jgi:hypothetical protein
MWSTASVIVLPHGPGVEHQNGEQLGKVHTRAMETDTCCTSSRNILISPHCNPCNPDCADLLMTAYHTLLSSSLASWSPKHTLSPEAFVTFVQSVLDGLPSSSSTSTISTSNAAVFGEILIDMLWSVDAELEEIVVEAKSALANCVDHSGASHAETKGSQVLKNCSASYSRVMKVKENAENDKEVVTVIVQKLLVRLRLHFLYSVSYTYIARMLALSIRPSVGNGWI